MEASMAKYIVKQYVAASGGDAALDAISSMYAMGKVRMTASEFRTGSDVVGAGVNKCITGMGTNGGGAKKSGKGGGGVGGGGEMGGFVLWQKKPELWCLELVVSGCKISAGSDGRVAWRQTPWHQPHASRGPPRPLRRSLQGLDPRSTANLFANAVWIGEKTINGDDCFVLKLDADPAALRARSSSSVEIIRHTVWGYFSHRTGLLVQLADTHMLRIKAAGGGGDGGGGGGGDDDDSVYWETSMESLIEDYRPVDGVNIAHAGRTAVSLFRFGDSAEGHTRTRMEEAWTVEEVDFNIWGLSMECFLPPGELKKEQQEGSGGTAVDVVDLQVTSSGRHCKNNNAGVLCCFSMVLFNQSNLRLLTFTREQELNSTMWHQSFSLGTCKTLPQIQKQQGCLRRSSRVRSGEAEWNSGSEGMILDEETLQQKLEVAVKEENYALAAKLRDNLQLLHEDNKAAVLAANSRFYNAFRNGNLVAMRSIWAKGDNICCVHPGAGAISGYELVMDSWEVVCGADHEFPIKIELNDVEVYVKGDVGYVTCLELIKTKGSSWGKQVATNVFERVDGQWYICIHHASHVDL